MGDNQEIKNLDKTWVVASTLLLSVFIFYIGYNPSTGPILVMSQGWLSLVALASLLSIAIKLCKFAKCKYQSKPYEIFRFFRPIVLFVFAASLVFYLKPREEEAIAFLEKQAEIATELCNSEGKCPQSLSGWVKHDSRYMYSFYSSGNTLFYMFYVPNGNTFNMYINYGLDMQYPLSGGVNKPVSKGRHHAP